MGLINAQASQQSAAPAQAAQPAGNMPQPQDHAAIMKRVNNVVMAAQKIMYGDKTSKMFMKQLQASGKTPEERAGMAAAGVIALLLQQVDGKMDPRTLVPAGVIIVADLMDFLGQTEGQKFGEDENNEAIKIFLEQLTQAAGGQQPAQGVM
jgi:hypothetical protein